MDNKERIEELVDKLISFKKEDETFEPIASILTTHLYVEFFMNHILIKKLGYSQKKIDKLGFYIKLTILFDQKLIPDWLHFNINKLNKIRNNFAHNIDAHLLYDKPDKIDIPKFELYEFNNKSHSWELKNMVHDCHIRDERNLSILIALVIPESTVVPLLELIKKQGI